MPKNRPGRSGFCAPLRESGGWSRFVGSFPVRVAVDGVRMELVVVAVLGPEISGTSPSRAGVCGSLVLWSESAAVAAGARWSPGGPVRRAAIVDRRRCLPWSLIGLLVSPEGVAVWQLAGELAVPVPEPEGTGLSG
jgi:hypothetical protein